MNLNFKFPYLTSHDLQMLQILSPEIDKRQFRLSITTRSKLLSYQYDVRPLYISVSVKVFLL